MRVYIGQFGRVHCTKLKPRYFSA